MTRRILILLGSIALVLMLAVPMAASCAPATPEEAREEISALKSSIDRLEGDVASKYAEISNLKAEIAGLRAPVEVFEWDVPTWQTSGVVWDGLCFMADYVERASDGRLVIIPRRSGEIIPLADQLDAVSTGVVEAADLGAPVYSGQIPWGVMGLNAAGVPRSASELSYLFEMYEDAKLWKLFQENFAKYGDIYLVGYHYWESGSMICSRVPIPSIADIKGLKFRSTGHEAAVIEAMGGTTVWAPAEEIYTLLATGVVDGCTFSNAVDCVALGIPEVTSYWLREPLMGVLPCADDFIVNGSVWQALPDDLKSIVELGLRAASARSHALYGVTNNQAWKAAADSGIEVVRWSDEDKAAFSKIDRAYFEASAEEDPSCAEVFDIIKQFALEMGYY